MELSSVIQFFTEVGDTPEIWVSQIFAIVLATTTLNYISKRIIKRLIIQTAKSKSVWDDALVHAIGKPITMFLWIYGLCFAADVAYEVSQAPFFELVDEVRTVAIVLLVAWFLNRFIRASEINLCDPNFIHKPMDKTTVVAVGKVLRASVSITAILIVMQTLGYSISGVLAFGGIGGIAVGFAAKDLLANFFGGLMIYLDRPFAVGDWIRSPDKQIEGTVEDIGWRLTRIRTFDKRPLYVPNSIFASISVENPSRMTNRRIYEHIGIRYCDIKKMQEIVKEVREMLAGHPDIDTTKTLIVNFNKFSPSSIDFMIYTFTKTTVWVDYHGIKEDVFFKIAEIVEKHGAEMAFPTSTIHIPDNLNVEGLNQEQTA